MDVHEIALAFRSSAHVTERVRQVHRERLDRIIRGEGQQQLTPGGLVLIHVVPIPVFTGAATLDLDRVSQQGDRLRPIYTDHAEGGRFNIDGYLAYGHHPDGGRPLAYLQVFRNGVIETVTSVLIGDDPADRYIPILAIEQQVIEAVDRMLLIVRDCDLGLPVSISISLTNVNGKEIPLGGRRLPRIHPTPIDRDVLNLPDVLVQEHGLSTSRILRPAFDALWQAGGFPQSRNYNAAGEWAPER